MRKREIILDTETTGLKPDQGHRVIEICGMEVINGIKTGRVFHKYINPQRDVPYEAFSIHGISTEFLQDKEIFSDIAVSFLEFIEDSILVIHNAKFDVGFLNHELKKLSHPLINFANVVDTLALARKKFPGAPASLDSLCKRFKISLAKRDKHGALIDVELLYEVYKFLVDDRFLIKPEENKIINSDNLSAIKKEKKYIEPRDFIIETIELNAHEEFLNKVKNPLWKN